MNLPGSTQVAYGKRFFESLPWTRLTPMPESVAWAAGGPGDPLLAPQACGIADELRAVYVLDARAIVVRQLASAAKYQLVHFDTVTSERTAPVEFTTDTKGEYRCEPPSHGHDWVLLITKKP